MPFKKLHSDIQEKLEYLDITQPSSFQKKSIPVIKSGVNTYCSAPKDSGKTTTLIVTTLQKLKCEAVGNAPRAIVLVEDSDKALALHETFLTYTKHTSLRVYVAHEKLHVDLQKSEIFEGVDILISTPKAIKKLFLLNGVNTAQLKIFSVDDAAFLVDNLAYTTLLSITQSIAKCQFVLYFESIPEKLKRFESSFMEYSKTISM
ncbi:DEAD/DEAH box helicase [Aquimarina sp. W85]|uniref:DEAD/DEAH box helicase n=1 Tax=Aquimarina rhodophyticola TaxID=3342246 RepID=UPI0036714FCC